MNDKIQTYFQEIDDNEMACIHSGTMKRCRTCGKIKPVREFIKFSGNKDGLGIHCKECENKQNKKRYYTLIGTLKSRKRHLRCKYGMTLENYNEILAYQNGVCAICKQMENVVDPKRNKVRSLSIDHDHITGMVRGLLCHSCNIMLKDGKDNIETLQAAIDYITNPPAAPFNLFTKDKGNNHDQT